MPLTESVTVGLVLEGMEFAAEARAALQALPVRVLFEHQGTSDLENLLANIDRVRPDVLLADFRALKEPYEDFVTPIKETACSPQLVALHNTADPETILSVMHAGADAYVYPPLAANLPKALERVMAGVERQRYSSSGSGGKTIGFLSVKGGCGATTIACHLAVELARLGTKEVLLADFDLDAGLIGFLMKSKSRFTVLDALTNTDRLDLSYWRAIISNGIPRLQIVRAPGVQPHRPEPGQNDVRTVLRFVRYQYDWIVLDLGRGINPLVLSGLEEVDDAFLVTTLDVPALHQAKEIVRGLIENGYSSERLHLVLNRVPKNPDVLPSELEDLLGIKVYAMLPDDYGSIYEAYAEGQLLSAATPLGKQLVRTAARIAGVQEQTGKKRFSLFGD